MERSRYLLDARKSLLGQDSVAIEWIVCVDGSAEQNLSTDFLQAVGAQAEGLTVKLLHTAGRIVGASAARNYALASATGSYVSSLDDDDLLPANAFENRLQRLEEDPELHWAGGWLQDMSSQGGRTGIWYPPAPAQQYSPGSIFDHWKEPSASFPMNTAGILMRTDSLRAVGGWQGLPTAEDFGMVIGLTGVHSGFIADEVIYLYRKHAEQTMESEGFQDLELSVRRAVWQRGKVLESRRFEHR